MINFFRKIRQQLLSQNKVSKYLLYAIGEIVLVVIGILIALQINNWNEERRDRIIEQKVLEGLAKNLEMNIERFEKRLNNIQWYSKSGEIILSIIENKREETDTLRQHWNPALINGSGEIITIAGYEALKNVGFEIISNAVVKDEIINLYEDTYLLQLNLRQNWGTEVKPDLDKYITEHFSWNIISRERVPHDYHFIINDNYFIGLIKTAALQRAFITNALNKSLKESQRVLQLIKDELKE
ncbi:DUF6090 family protein [Eudoraea adriatica]|uniref:DUF6090 family protein n=1 Tax=Eudoraea adriatica TaxID=446681 RepID=UPI00037B7E07|nr:DUF6090 family protein [Eudoraea adriatica]